MAEVGARLPLPKRLICKIKPKIPISSLRASRGVCFHVCILLFFIDEFDIVVDQIDGRQRVGGEVLIEMYFVVLVLMPIIMPLNRRVLLTMISCFSTFWFQSRH